MGNAMERKTETQPTSEWEHSHALNVGDKLTDTNTGTNITVKRVRDDGGVVVKLWYDEHGGEDYTTDEWTEEQTRIGLRDGLLERDDGKSHELATF